MLKTYIRASEMLRRLREDQEGAALVEYSVLIGLIVALTIATIVFVGDWADAQWTALETELKKTDTQPAAT